MKQRVGCRLGIENQPRIAPFLNSRYDDTILLTVDIWCVTITKKRKTASVVTLHNWMFAVEGSHLLPIVDKKLWKPGNPKCFTNLDFASTFWRIRSENTLIENHFYVQAKIVWKAKDVTLCLYCISNFPAILPKELKTKLQHQLNENLLT